MEDLKVTVEKVLGFCDLPMKPGEGFEVRGGALVFPKGGKFCLWALASLIPFFPAKQRCSDDPNDWMPRCELLSCPDPKGRVIFRVERLFPQGQRAKAPRTNLRLNVKAERCTGCRACELACCEAHEQGYLPDLSRIRIESDDATCTDLPRVCRQCGVASCVRACPQKALLRDERTGAILVDSQACTGCGVCAKACPFGAIPFDFRTRKAMPCDLCGGDPLCVKRCPSGALELIELQD